MGRRKRKTDKVEPEIIEAPKSLALLPEAQNNASEAPENLPAPAEPEIFPYVDYTIDTLLNIEKSHNIKIGLINDFKTIIEEVKEYDKLLPSDVYSISIDSLTESLRDFLSATKQTGEILKSKIELDIKIMAAKQALENKKTELKFKAELFELKERSKTEFLQFCAEKNIKPKPFFGFMFFKKIKPKKIKGKFESPEVITQNKARPP